MLGKIQLWCSAVLALLLLFHTAAAQSSSGLSSGQSTWGVVPESIGAPSTIEEPAWRTAKNFPSPSQGVPTPAEGQPTPLRGQLQPTPAERQPTRVAGQPTPADPISKPPGTLELDSQPGILSEPLGAPLAKPEFDSNLSIGPGGYARIPESKPDDKAAPLFTFGDEVESGYVLGPNGEMILDPSGVWPGTTNVCPPPPAPKTMLQTHFPVISSFCNRSLGMLGHRRARKAGCLPCTTAPWFYGGFEYMHWWTRGMPVPSVITTSPDGTPIDEAGVSGLPTTSSLLGPGRLDAQDNAAGRFNFGFYLDPCHCSSIESDFFLLDGSRFSFYASAPQDYSILARPYFNTLSGLQDAELIGYPGSSEGWLRAVGETDLYGGGIALRRNLYCGSGFQPGCNRLGACLSSCGNGIDQGCGWVCSKLQWLPAGGLMPVRVDGLVGWRAYEMDESLTITENRTVVDPAGALPLGTATSIVDQFETRNTFHGAVFGTDTDWAHGRWGVVSRLRVSLGQMRRRASIAGQTTVTEPSVVPVSYNAGLQALASNIGSYANSEFVAVPEVGLDGYFLLRPNMRLKAGYTFLYLTDVWRPGTVLDTSLDPRLIPPPSVATADNPSLIPRSDDFWAQGINLGVEWRY